MKVLVKHSGLLDVERQHIIAELAKLGYEVDFERTSDGHTVLGVGAALAEKWNGEIDRLAYAVKAKVNEPHKLERDLTDMIKVSMIRDNGMSWLESIREASKRKGRGRKR